ncbi:DUF3450 domain-containing protein [Algimonas arctica]|uniref:DUF3450 domain-containing protein n=2 Tax=Algimonas arctica TaxID=1479486 RepID=A0A8J3CPX5_9PROT|nr:DUF3450 domain-containing protein [Algimonas arctica]
MAGPAFAQDGAAPSVDQYKLVLQEISDRRTNLAQRQFYIQQQNEEIASLSTRIAGNSASSASDELLPLVREMVAEIEKVMVSDLPFRIERRFALLDDLRADLQAEEVSVFDVYRRAMQLYSQEVGYGLQVSSYQGLNPIADRQGQRYKACLAEAKSPACDLSKEQKIALENGAEIEDLEEQLYDGNYIHFGRLALLYLERDSSEGYRYNQTTSQWDELSNSELLGLRQNVRIARGESAIGTMTAPIRIGEAGADAS